MNTNKNCLRYCYISIYVYMTIQQNYSNNIIGIKHENISVKGN